MGWDLMRIENLEPIHSIAFNISLREHDIYIDSFDAVKLGSIDRVICVCVKKHQKECHLCIFITAR